MSDYTDQELGKRLAEIYAEGERLQGPSLAERFALLPQHARDEVYESMRAVEWLRLQYDWNFWGRPKQLEMLKPSDCDTRIMLGGRGMGKTRTSGQTSSERIMSGELRSVCFIAPDTEDLRRIMLGGIPGSDSGLFDCLPPWLPPDSQDGYIYNQNKKEIYFPRFDCTVFLNTGEKKEQRGGNFGMVVIEEPIKFRYLDTVFMNLDMALRDPDADVQTYLYTTPKNQRWLKDLIMEPGTRVIHGTTDENRGNLSAKFLRRVFKRYAGTRLGRQELEARILGDVEGALWTSAQIERARVALQPKFADVGVGFDPAVSEKRLSDAYGIIAAGRGVDEHLYYLEDCSDHYSPGEACLKVVRCAKAWGAKWVVGERNKIGDWVRKGIADACEVEGYPLEIREVYSIKDKGKRAELVANLHTADPPRAHHVGRAMGEFETEQTTWQPSGRGPSPNRIDAAAHVGDELMGLSREPEQDVEHHLAELEKLNEGFQGDAWTL